MGVVQEKYIPALKERGIEVVGYYDPSYLPQFAADIDAVVLLSSLMGHTHREKVISKWRGMVISLEKDISRWDAVLAPWLARVDTPPVPTPTPTPVPAPPAPSTKTFSKGFIPGKEEEACQAYKELYVSGKRKSKEDLVPVAQPFVNYTLPSGHAAEMLFERRAEAGLLPKWFAEWHANERPKYITSPRSAKDRLEGAKKEKKTAADKEAEELALLYSEEVDQLKKKLAESTRELVDVRAKLAKRDKEYLEAMEEIVAKDTAIAAMAKKGSSDELLSAMEQMRTVIDRLAEENRQAQERAEKAEARTKELLSDLKKKETELARDTSAVVGISEERLTQLLFDVLSASKINTAQRFLRPVAKTQQEFKAFMVQLALRPLADAKILSPEDLGPFGSWINTPQGDN